ncbi:arginine--tRNA ligase [Candidatus Daviesbacteria bacterium GWA1_38_6]|nr:MAG: arginine--tRNA ligase [Candidatus Daviesbacteria bacterium GWA1_38_6]
MFKSKILEDLKKAVEELGYKSSDPDKIGADIVLSIPKNPEFGEYTSNIALQLAKQKSPDSKQSPVQIANEILSHLSSLNYLEKVEVAGGGFINFFIKPNALLESLHQVCDYASLVNPSRFAEASQDEKKKVFMEYSQPNTHKLFHIGHTRNISLGESLSRLLESQGNKVFRSTYGSDIGLPVAKAIWGIKKLETEYKKIKKQSLNEKIVFLAKAYTLGAGKYEEDDQIKGEINGLNKLIYQKDPSVELILEETRQWSKEYFEHLYQKIGVKFDRSFWESEVEEEGKKLVEENLEKVFVSDQGAIIFPGEKHSLHNRVFVTTAGYPTYEAKDLRLAKVKMEIWPFDSGIILSGSEQAEYFKVMFKALELIDPGFKDKMINFPFGMVNLPSGKMASRTGDVITFDWLHNEVKKRIEKIMNRTSTAIASPSARNDEMAKEEKEQVINQISLGAIKFSMLKYAPHTDITFDIEKSVSLSGDSGPYIQYTYARAKSVLRNAQYDYDVDLPHSVQHPQTVSFELEKEERLILQKIEHFEAIVIEAAESLHPNIIASFLLDLASLFNLFYQKHPIIKGENSDLRLALTCSVAVILKQGLYLLGIEAPERM